MKIGVIGLGLMGASASRSLVKKGHVVFGSDIDKKVLDYAISNGIISGELDEKNAKDIDLVILSVFPESFCVATEKVLPWLKKSAIVLDFCGIKRKIEDDMLSFSKEYPDLYFVGGHPMAGREVYGIENSIDDLFTGASMILVPVVANESVMNLLNDLFLEIGFARVVKTDSENHDAMIAYTSQLCHVVSNAFIKNSTAKRHFGYSAGSYKDMTRVARLNPVMWTELMNANRDKLTVELDELITNLQKYNDALKSGDKDMLKALLEEGNQTKLSIDKKE